MAIPGDLVPPDVGALMRRIDTLERDVRELSAARTGEAMTIGSGGLTVDGGFFRAIFGNDVQSVYIGPLLFSGVSYHGIILRYANGEPLFYTFPLAGDPNVLAWRWLDGTGREILSADGLTGGLARPWIPIELVPKFSMASGSVFGYYSIDAAAIAAETQVWEGRIPLVSHPYAEIDGLWGQASGSNTTTYRLKVSGAEIGSWTVGGGLSNTRRGPYDISQWLGFTWLPIEVTADSSGTGLVAIHVVGCAQRQT